MLSRTRLSEVYIYIQGDSYKSIDTVVFEHLGHVAKLGYSSSTLLISTVAHSQSPDEIIPRMLAKLERLRNDSNSTSMYSHRNNHARTMALVVL